MACECGEHCIGRGAHRVGRRLGGGSDSRLRACDLEDCRGVSDV